jgi:hypothetical protein
MAGSRRRGLGLGRRVGDGKEGSMEMGHGMNAGQGQNRVVGGGGRVADDGSDGGGSERKETNPVLVSYFIFWADKWALCPCQQVYYFLCHISLTGVPGLS